MMPAPMDQPANCPDSDDEYADKDSCPFEHRLAVGAARKRAEGMTVRIVQQSGEVVSALPRTTVIQ